MKQLIENYLSRQYFVDTTENEVKKIIDNSVFFLADLSNEIRDVFGIDGDEGFIYITNWCFDKGLKDFYKHWHRYSQRGMIYAPYIPIMVKPIIISGSSSYSVSGSAVNLSYAELPSFSAKSVSSRYMERPVNENYYGTITID